MSWTALKNRKYAGKTLPQIILSDPDYFFWAVEQDIFKNDQTLASEANELNYKARNIRIPEGMKAEYWVHRPTGKFDHINLVQEDRLPHEGSSKTFYKDVIDLSVPRQISDYDKRGCKNMILSVKIHLFGDRHIRLTKEFCEKFFENDGHFVLSGEFRQEMGCIFR